MLKDIEVKYLEESECPVTGGITWPHSNYILLRIRVHDHISGRRGRRVLVLVLDIWIDLQRHTLTWRLHVGDHGVGNLLLVLRHRDSWLLKSRWSSLLIVRWWCHLYWCALRRRPWRSRWLVSIDVTRVRVHLESQEIPARRFSVRIPIFERSN